MTVSTVNFNAGRQKAKMIHTQTTGNGSIPLPILSNNKKALYLSVPVNFYNNAFINSGTGANAGISSQSKILNSNCLNLFSSISSSQQDNAYFVRIYLGIGIHYTVW